MKSEDSNCHQSREKQRQNCNLKRQQSRDARLLAPDVEFKFPEIIDHNSDQRQKVLEDERATNLNEDVHLNLQAIDTVTASDTDRNVDDAEENKGEQVDTMTSNGRSYLSATGKETETDSTAEHRQSIVTNTDIHTNGVCRVEFTSIHAMAVHWKDENTEEDVVAPTHVFDKLFQDYLNKLTIITPKANDLEGDSHTSTCENVEQLDVLLVDNDRVDVEHSAENQSVKIKDALVEIIRDSVTIVSDDDDDECISIASSSNAASCEEDVCEDMEMEAEEESEDAIIDMAASADIRFQYPSQTMSDKTQEQTSQVMSMNNSTAPVDQLSGRSGQVKSNNLPFQLLDRETQEVPNDTIESGSSEATNSFSPLTNLLKSNLKVPSSLKQHMIIHSGEKFVSYEREKEVSSPDGSQSPAMTQTLPSSNQPQKAREVPSLLSPRDISNIGRSSFLRHVEALAFSNNLPDGATLVDKRGIFCTQDKLKPFVCGFCGDAYGRMDLVNRHIEQQHNAIPRFACEFCSQRFGHQYHFSQHLKSHHSQMAPLKHRELNLLSCDVCNKSFQTKVDFVTHCKAHEEEKLTKILTCTCSICKKVFRSPSTLKQHMIIHCGETPLESSLLEEQIQSKTGLLNHTISSNDEQVSGITNSDKFRNEDVSECEVAIVREPQIQNTTETISIESDRPTEGDSSKAVIEKRVSVETGVVHEDEVSSQGSQSPIVTQTLLSSDHSVTEKSIPSSYSRQSHRDLGASSTFRRHFESNHGPKLPPGSKLLSYRGVFRIKDEEKPFACGYCGKSYKSNSAVYLHIRCEHDEKRHSCEFCGKRFAESSFLAVHIRTHTQENPFTCDQCGKQFRFDSDLRNHKHAHSEERLFHCDQCSKSYKTNNGLSIHKESHKTEEQRKGLTCDICKRKFGMPSLLKNHMMLHTGEKPFKCTLCDKKYRLKVQLRNHMDNHSGMNRNANKPCSICGKTFSTNHMPDHMRMHAVVKTFECNVCGKWFLKKENLEGHMGSHTGEKPFACDRSDKRYTLHTPQLHGES